MRNGERAMQPNQQNFFFGQLRCTGLGLRSFHNLLISHITGRSVVPRSGKMIDIQASARLQYELTQRPRLLMFLSKPLLNLLQSALDAHRLALGINKDNVDLLL